MEAHSGMLWVGACGGAFRYAVGGCLWMLIHVCGGRVFLDVHPHNMLWVCMCVSVRVGGCVCVCVGVCACGWGGGGGACVCFRVHACVCVLV